MTLGEFKSWLEGYLEGGGKDIEVVRERLQQVHEMAPLVPTLPLPHWPNDPYYPVPSPFTWMN